MHRMHIFSIYKFTLEKSSNYNLDSTDITQDTQGRHGYQTLTQTWSVIT